MVEFNLFEKTELRIERISLKGTNLNDVAAVVAEVLGMGRQEVWVTDVQSNSMTIDLLRKTVNPYALVGKKDILFKKLSELPGIEISGKTSICSEGMLGWIALDREEAKKALKRAEKMAEEIRQKIAKRVFVFATGTEVLNGQIEDTNTPSIAGRLEKEDYAVTIGPALKDDADYIAAHLRQVVEAGGYSLIIITGGVGAELKDCTIEALLMVDPESATPYICEFKQGTGRHAKQGVRIGVGQAFGTMIVALPGPNDEVKRGLEALIRGLHSHLDKKELAGEIAGSLKRRLLGKMKEGHG